MTDQLTLLPCGPIAPDAAPPPPLASIPPGTTRGPEGWQDRLHAALDGVEVWVPRAGGWIPIGPLVNPQGARSLVAQWDRLGMSMTFDLGHYPITWAVAGEEEEGDGE
jgi:hypothetical protein